MTIILFWYPQFSTHLSLHNIYLQSIVGSAATDIYKYSHIWVLQGRNPWSGMCFGQNNPWNWTWIWMYMASLNEVRRSSHRSFSSQWIWMRIMCAYVNHWRVDNDYVSPGNLCTEIMPLLEVFSKQPCAWLDRQCDMGCVSMHNLRVCSCTFLYETATEGQWSRGIMEGGIEPGVSVV